MMKCKPFALCALVLLADASIGVRAQSSVHTNSKEPKLTLDNCIERAALYHGVNIKTLKAIVYQESLGKPDTINHNKNKSIDYGASGINSIHLPELAKHGITSQHLMDGCINVFVGAWKYSKQVAKHGNTWTAVGSYHSSTPRFRDAYIGHIQRHLTNWGYLPKSTGTGGYQFALTGATPAILNQSTPPPEIAPQTEARAVRQTIKPSTPVKVVTWQMAHTGIPPIARSEGSP